MSLAARTTQTVLLLALLSLCACAPRMEPKADPSCTPSVSTPIVLPSPSTDGVTLYGRVLNNHFDPVIGARVAVWKEMPTLEHGGVVDPSLLLRQVETDINGVYRCPALFPPSKVWVTIEVPGFRLLLPPPAMLTPENRTSTQLDFLLCGEQTLYDFGIPPTINMKSTSD